MDQQNLTEEQQDTIKEALKTGQRVLAIKHFREFTGSDLAESKLRVDAMLADLHRAQPDVYKLPEEGGCLGAVVLCLTAMVYFLSDKINLL